MHDKNDTIRHTIKHKHLLGALCAGLVLAASPVLSPSLAPVAYAQELNQATQSLFLAVKNNDLPGVKAATDNGADILARGINGQQAVDMAIELGYLDIAHYLVSARNQLDSSTPPKAIAAAPTKPSATKAFISTFFDFFKAPNTTGIMRKNTPVGSGGQDALTDEELAQQLHQLEAELGDAPIKGPAVPISPDELALELPPSPVLPDDVIAKDAAPFDTPALPAYGVTAPGEAVVQRPEVSNDDTFGDDAFGDLAVNDITADDEPPAPSSTIAPEPMTSSDPNLPFGGGVDPDILDLLGLTPFTDEEPALDEAAADPFSQPEDPFTPQQQDTPEPADDSVAGLLEGFGDAQEVAPLKTHKPSLPGDTQETSDPFAAVDDVSDPFAPSPESNGEVDELAGLLEGIGEEISGQNGWDVKKVEGGSLPSEMPTLSEIDPTGEALDGVELTLGASAIIGQEVGEDRLKMMEADTIHKPCLKKGGPQTVYCVDKVTWPFELEEYFLVDTIMYQGTRSIVRYDAGRASYFHSLYNSDAFSKVVEYYIGRFGQPTQVVDRAIAPLAQPRRDNPTYIWQSREPGTDTITALEIRQYDDARGGFPDTKRGVVLLYRAHTGGIFPQLSQLELMVLKDSGAMDLAPKTPESVW